ncbi:hypothetical protein LVD17_00130 [Fulvivirga ulvae]|uniref:hypothetical protein n=1 Tax=Fulvivirga ulvae TaxID=2904245 RepID=UPI001F376B10|nr:hypothetical protein [Fulvivirga ulvae]UII32210.1 hypothetical protein LVD17_28395 [Fulvivirga ulvae]UII32243.1 hypothetical protein LVD17_00130 [Fulvivirga ulvae]
MGIPLIIWRLMQLEDLIASKSTGTLEELAAKLEMNTELTKAYIGSLAEMRECKIEYDARCSSFVFVGPNWV